MAISYPNRSVIWIPKIQWLHRCKPRPHPS